MNVESYLTEHVNCGLHLTLRTAKVEKPRECSLSYELVLKGDLPLRESRYGSTVKLQVREDCYKLAQTDRGRSGSEMCKVKVNPTCFM